MNRLLLVALLASIGLTACSKKEEAAVAAAPPVAAAAAPVTAATAANTGKILQAMPAGGYMYAEVDAGGGKKIWIAGAPIEVKVGDSVQWGDFAVMQNFNSKTLNRTFDEILFVNSWGPVGGAAAQVAAHGTMPNKSAAAQPQQEAQAGAASDTQGEVKSVKAAAGYSYLEITQNGAVVWVAAPETAVKVGDKVRWSGGSMMQNFTAKSLNRTFDQIIFASNVVVVK